MSTDKKIEVHVDKDVKVLEIREGKALELYQDGPVTIEGTISAPSRFFKERKEQHDVKRCHVVFSYRKLYVNFICVENRNDKKYVLKGALQINPDIASLGVNTKDKYTSKELSDLLRFNKFFFADKAQATAIVSNLQKFKAKIEKEIEAFDDNKGNKKDLYEVKTTGNHDLEYTLEMPLFIGQPNVRFRVDVCVDVTDGDILFYLESTELSELNKGEAEKIINAELKNFEGTGIAIIEQP